MLRVDWERFGAAVRAQAVVDASRYNDIEKRLGVSHTRMINAAQGKPLGTDIFLTLCHWMQQDPMHYATPSVSPETNEMTNIAEIAGGLRPALRDAVCGKFSFACPVDAEDGEIELVEAGLWNELYGSNHGRLTPLGEQVRAHILDTREEGR